MNTKTRITRALGGGGGTADCALPAGGSVTAYSLRVDTHVPPNAYVDTTLLAPPAPVGVEPGSPEGVEPTGPAADLSVPLKEEDGDGQG